MLERWEKPFLTAFGDRDPIFRGAGHFIQEDQGGELVRVVSDFIARNPLRA